MDVKLKRTWSILILFWLSFFALTGHAQENCSLNTNNICLLTFLKKQLSEYDRTQPAAEKAWIELNAELQLSGQPIAPATEINPTALKALLEKLNQEEQFLNAIKQKKFSEASRQRHRLTTEFNDAHQLTVDLILIENYTLTLQDDKATQTKENAIKTILEKNEYQRSLAIMGIARSELIGGAPEKGLKTLSSTLVDEFSNAELFQEKRLLTLLAEHSKKLYLQPEKVSANCQTNKQTLIESLKYFFSNRTLESLSSLYQTPNKQLVYRHIIDYARLYNHTEFCPLYSTLIIQQMIQTITKTTPSNEQDVIHLIQVARSIRRYWKM